MIGKNIGNGHIAIKKKLVSIWIAFQYYSIFEAHAKFSKRDFEHYRDFPLDDFPRLSFRLKVVLSYPKVYPILW